MLHKIMRVTLLQSLCVDNVAFTGVDTRFDALVLGRERAEVIASSGFEEPVTVTGSYYDHQSHSFDHKLAANSHQPAVQYAPSKSCSKCKELGFQTWSSYTTRERARTCIHDTHKRWKLYIELHAMFA